jgi:hypothetical protein
VRAHYLERLSIVRDTRSHSVAGVPYGSSHAYFYSVAFMSLNWISLNESRHLQEIILIKWLMLPFGSNLPAVLPIVIDELLACVDTIFFYEKQLPTPQLRFPLHRRIEADFKCFEHDLAAKRPNIVPPFLESRQSRNYYSPPTRSGARAVVHGYGHRSDSR